MGNSIQKKKKTEAESNYSAPLSPNHAREKAKGFWLFGRTEKVKIGKRSTGCVEEEEELIRVVINVHFQSIQGRQLIFLLVKSELFEHK